LKPVPPYDEAIIDIIASAISELIMDTGIWVQAVVDNWRDQSTGTLEI